jgi:hypothetical protein
MQDIKCPKCNEIITIDESRYAEILKQVRDVEFNKQVKETVEAKVAQSTFEATKKVDELNHQRELDKITHDNEIAKKDSEFAVILKKVSDEKDYYKDLKAKANVKGLGEDLEQWCQREFDKIRAAAFPNAKFGKDNDASSGTKGDFIFRDYDDEGNQFISIMFEMKNQADDTKDKSKNEEFYKKLDTDRKKKGCEYAVLVSLLEIDNDLFSGIVDVSHLYEKMYVVRPQDFISIITLLRNPARKLIGLKAELEVAKKQEIDVTNFEARLNTWKVKFGRNAGLFQKNYDESIKQIDKAIKALQDTRDALMDTSKYMDLSASNLDDLTIKRLTYNNPSMAAKFNEVESSTGAEQE